MGVRNEKCNLSLYSLFGCFHGRSEMIFTSRCSSEEWQKIGNMERNTLGITVEDDGEFW